MANARCLHHRGLGSSPTCSTYLKGYPKGILQQIIYAIPVKDVVGSSSLSLPAYYLFYREVAQ